MANTATDKTSQNKNSRDKISIEINTEGEKDQPQTQRRQLFGYYAAYVALGLVGASLGPTLPGLAENTGVGLGEAGLFFTSRSLGYTLGSLYGGRAYDRLPGHTLMAGTIAMMVIALGLAPVTAVFWILLVVLFAMGVGEGTLDVGGNTLLLWQYRQRVGPYMNALHFFFGAGSFLSPIIVAQALELGGGIRWAYWVLALAIAPLALWLARLPSPGAPTIRKDDPDSRARPLLIFLVAAFFFLYVGTEAGFGGWVFTYAQAVPFNGAGLESATAAYLTSAFWGALTLGRLLSIPLAARLRPSVLLLVDLVGCLLSLGAILIWRDATLALWAGAIGLGASMASIFPTMLSFAERRMPISGRTTGLFFVGVGSGAMSVPWLVGQLFEASGPLAMIYLFLGVLTLDLVVLLVLLFTTQRRVSQQSPKSLQSSVSD